MTEIEILPPLPPQTHVKYIGEGSANIVFRISPPVSSDQHLYRGRLLRVPNDKLVTRFTCEDHQVFYHDKLVPILDKSWLVDQRLIDIRHGKIRDALNAELDRLETAGGRPARRLGIRVADTEHALLVEDMSEKPGENVVVTFKSKWLAPSPTLPAGSMRCRNCAKLAEARTRGKESDTSFCPLYLLDMTRSGAAAEAAEGKIRSVFRRDLTEEQQARALEWIRETGLFLKLAEIQASYDPNGALNTSADDVEAVEKLQLAMTLRDCSVMLTVPTNPAEPARCQITDLDRKDGSQKLPQWQELESKLISGGYYLGSDNVEGVDCQMGSR
jgi:inositol-pentakisphosphate 2-kinase